MSNSTSITESKAAPPWLEPLLSAVFFHTCKMHRSETRSDCNMYCLRCKGNAFCKHCLSAHDKDHRVIQIRRNVYREVVRVSDIESILDISGVQRYTSNEYEVVYLNKKPKTPKPNNNTHKCETCERSLTDPECPFCSLRCKLAASKKNGDVSLVLSDKNKKDEELKEREEQKQEEEEGGGGEGEGEEEESVEAIQRQMNQSEATPIQPPVIPQATSNSSNRRRRRRRKGNPRRAPFF